MGRISVRHLVEKPSGFYFQATAAMRAAGIASEPLGADKAKAIERAEYLNAMWDEIRRGQEVTVAPTPAAGTFDRLAYDYLRSTEHRDKGLRTREEVEWALEKMLRPIFGPTHLTRITPEHCQRYYDHLRGGHSVHKAHKTMKWLRYILNFAVRQQRISTNPALAVRVKRPAARTNVWRPDQVQAVIAAAREMGRPCIATATAIAYDTSISRGDILALEVRQYDGESLWLTGEKARQKTGQNYRVPLYPETKAMIEAELRRWPSALPNSPIIRAPHGRPYLENNFGNRFRDACRLAGIPEALQFRDIRRTASKERSEAGATEAELAASTGHSIERGSQILDVYNPRSYTMAKSAQDKRRARVARTKGDLKV